MCVPPEEYGVMSIRVFDPTAEDAPATNPGAARLTSLEGRTIGLLDNGKFRVRELLDHESEGVHGVLHSSTTTPLNMLRRCRTGCNRLNGYTGVGLVTPHLEERR